MDIYPYQPLIYITGPWVKNEGIYSKSASNVVEKITKCVSLPYLPAKMLNFDPYSVNSFLVDFGQVLTPFRLLFEMSIEFAFVLILNCSFVKTGYEFHLNKFYKHTTRMQPLLISITGFKLEIFLFEKMWI